MRASKAQIAAALPLLRKAARAKVKYYNACRAIELEVIGHDVNGLDEAIEGLAFNCDTPEDADRITAKDAKDTLKHVRRER